MNTLLPKNRPGSKKKPEQQCLPKTRPGSKRHAITIIGCCATKPDQAEDATFSISSLILFTGTA